jgi:hypothetical protein
MEIDNASVASADSHVPWEDDEDRRFKVSVVKGSLLAWYTGNIAYDSYLLYNDPYNTVYILRLSADVMGLVFLVCPFWWLVGTRTGIVGFVFIATQFQLPDTVVLFTLSTTDFVFATCGQMFLASVHTALNTCGLLKYLW